jgi:predicted TIM-barrel fold metal-dependent hydrolase
MSRDYESPVLGHDGTLSAHSMDFLPWRGAFPPLMFRIVHLLGRKENAADLEREVSRLFFDVATAVSPATFESLRNLTSTSQMLLGTDVPYIEMRETIPALDELQLTNAERYAINTGNALGLFPRLRSFIAVPA